MVALNFTVVVEMVLFLTFLWVTNRFIFQPLLRIMDARDARLKEDRTNASADAAETERLDAEYIERLTEANQAAAQRLRQARYEAYQHNRDETDKLRRESDAEIAAFREDLQAKLAEERRQYPELIAGLVETMDQWAAGGRVHAMNKRLLLGVTIVYFIGILVGLVLFRSPSLSKAYLQEYGKDHERYIATIKSEEFKAYEEKPALHPLRGKLEEDAKFAEEYRERKAFIHEEERIWWFVEYFKVLNSAAFILYLVALVGKPFLGFLDGQIKEIQKNLEDAAKARQDAAAKKAAARGTVDEWAQTEACIRSECEATVARHLDKIQTEAKDAAAVLEKQTEERKQGELYAAVRTIKTELVTEAIRRLEERYKTDLTQEELSVNVGRFVNLMERLS